MRCLKCGTEGIPGKKFCAECGSPLSNSCSKCASDNPPDAKFCADCGNALGPQLGSEIARPSKEAVSGIRIAAERITSDTTEGERKTVTALFADIKGSMELMEDLDPEEARAIVDPALRLMMDAVHRYDGYIVQSTGDGIFALFGAPVAHEDHPQRALYAALRMQEEMRRYAAGLRAAGHAPVEARVGVNTGEAVVRTLATGASHLEYTPIGHATGLAARMQTLAPTGSIAVTAATRKLCEGYFEFRSLGPTQVRGVSGAVEVHEVTGLGPLRTRLQVAAQRGLSKFVGREAELDAMRRASELARQGRGQMVAAVGEPGVGKSRLFYEFKVTSQSGWMVLEALSVSHAKASAYLPVIELLRGYFKIAPADDERSRREKINGKIITLDRALEDTLPYLFGLLGIVEGEDRLALMDPQVRLRRTLEAIKRILIRESLNQPLLLMFEDLHWIDDETQALLNLLADSIGTARVLMAVNYRPQYTHGWGSKSHYTQLRLDPLGKESAQEMLRWLLGDGAELVPLRRLIIDKTEGNPFFMEQIVHALFEQGALIRDGSLKLTRAVGELTVPTTVQALLGSRIDRLAADSKEMLQTLAVTGKEFALDVVREATKKPDDELERILHDLQSAEFIYEQPSVGGARYTFKHALTQEVAYNSVLGERRKQLHERVGAAIERLYAERLDDHLEELARHYGRGSDAGKAGDYLTRAGQQAAQRGLYRESLAHVRDAFARLGEVADPNLRLRRELPLQITLGNVLKFTEGSAKPGAEPAFLRAYQLCEAAGDAVSAVDRMSALRGLAGFYMDSGNYEAGIDTGRQMLALAQRQSDPRLLAAAHSFLGFFSMSRLDFPAARSHCERALELMRETPSRAGAISDVTFSAAITLSHLPVPLAYLGFSDQAAVRAREAIALGQGSPHEVICRANIGAFFALVRNWQLAQEHSEAALAIEIENGLFAMVGFTKATHGLAIAMLGDLDRGIEEIREALSDKSANAARMRAGGLRFLASACLEAGRAEEGLAALDEFDAFVKRPLIADVARGELLLIRNPADEEQAERLFRHVIELAREQSVPFFELHATTSLARLLKRQGKIAEARAKLAEIYNWFTEGFEFADLRDAKALLDELGT